MRKYILIFLLLIFSSCSYEYPKNENINLYKSSNNTENESYKTNPNQKNIVKNITEPKENKKEISNISEDCDYYCLYNLAIKNKNASICKDIKPKSFSELCITNISIELNDFSICEKFFNEIECFQKVSEKIKKCYDSDYGNNEYKKGLTCYKGNCSEDKDNQESIYEYTCVDGIKKETIIPCKYGEYKGICRDKIKNKNSSIIDIYSLKVKKYEDYEEITSVSFQFRVGNYFDRIYPHKLKIKIEINDKKYIKEYNKWPENLKDIEKNTFLIDGKGSDITDSKYFFNDGYKNSLVFYLEDQKITPNNLVVTLIYKNESFKFNFKELELKKQPKIFENENKWNI